MLANAQQIYGGELEITGYAITQGSYNNSVEASFGTHSGGGAVDLSVLQRGTYTVLWDDIEPLLRALRAAGFAAWLREYGELHPDSPIHIHAIAIGDQELSQAAQEQLTGEAGYFRGFNGLPVSMYGPPTPDRYGGPVLCQWMLDMGYRDMRKTPPTHTGTLSKSDRKVLNVKENLFVGFGEGRSGTGREGSLQQFFSRW